MPKSITFFSRGKTPIYVNYVIAHNTVGRPMRCHVQAPTDSPYIGRVTVMVVPSFSLLFKAMVP